ncbi:MAG TPA: SAM-dependent methyltransferase [Stellaceae bacterium]|nr:SAM-dependent methyltransferase [Stellaceae bacterium]
MPAGFTAYLAPQGFESELATELGEVSGSYGRLLLSPGPPKPVAWVANVWLDPRRLPIASIGDAARQLRGLQRNWALYAHAHYRRAALIAERLPPVSAKPLVFPAPPPTAPLGSWTLLDERTMLAATRCTSAFPNGEVRFVEDKAAPPSRAYLKLWEALTLLGRWPRPGERCLDLGSSPGGWTWALARLGAQVISVDKAPIEPRIVAMPGVEVRRESAFSVDPVTVGPLDWLFSDVVCYPERLLRMVERWLQSGRCGRFVCTVKFQGSTDHEIASRFAAIPGSRLLHLHHNKHELTWMLLVAE